MCTWSIQTLRVQYFHTFNQSNELHGHVIVYTSEEEVYLHAWKSVCVCNKRLIWKQPIKRDLKKGDQNIRTLHKREQYIQDQKTPEAGWIFRPAFRSAFHWKTVKYRQLDLYLTDIQKALLCGCGQDSLIPRLPILEHSIDKRFHESCFEDSPGGFGFCVQAEVRSFGKRKLFQRDCWVYLKR